MAKVRRGRFTLSTNIIMTASLITRTLAFGYIMMSIYIKVGDDILDEDVIKVVDMEDVAGMPLGTTMKSIVWSLIGVFVLELLTGIFGIWGAIGRRQRMLAITVLMSSLMIIIYGIYLVILSILYHQKSSFRETLYNYTEAFNLGSSYISWTYHYDTFPSFLSKLGCNGWTPDIYYCYENFNEQLSSYLKTYFGLIVTSIVCQVVTIVAAEYTYRKFEFKEKKPSVSDNKYYLLLTLQHGIFRSFVIFVRDNWKRSKLVFTSVSLKIGSLVIGTGLLGLGLTLIGDKFIHDSALKYIFKQIQFHNYYFYDILVGLAASAVVIGILTMVTSITGLIGSWRKSSKLLLTSSVMSNILHIPRIIAIIIWIYFVEEIDDVMRFQLGLQQQGYYYSNSQNTLTTRWNEMILTLKCCGVNNYTETLSSTYKERFCCENAHESRIEPGSRYSSGNNILTRFGGCGDYKTDTCTDVILFKTRMYIGWFLAIVLLGVIFEILGLIFVNKEYLMISSMKNNDTKTENDSTETSIFKTVYGGIKSLFIKNWRRSKMTLVYLISLIILFISNVGLLGIAINIRYDTVFGNSDIQDILSRFSIADHTFSKALNTFSIVVSTLSSLSIVAIPHSVVAIVSWRWRRIFLFTSAGLWSVIMVGNIVQIGLWGKFISSVDSSLTERLQTVLSAYEYSHASARSDYYPWDVSLGWNTLFVKAECCGVGTSFLSSFMSSSWWSSGDREMFTTQTIPVQCCVSQTEIFPYESKYDPDCTKSKFSGYYFSQGCDAAVEDRLKLYSIPFFVFMAVGILAEISCIVMTLYDAVRLPSEPNTMHLEKKANEGKVELLEVDEKPSLKPTNTVSDKKDKKKKKEKENSRKAAKSERKQSIEKQKSFVKQNTDETEKVKDNIEIQSLEETKKENERTKTNTEEMIDSKHLNKTENTNDGKKEETDSIDQQKNDEKENMHQEKEDKTMKDTSIQINETASDRTELKDKSIADVDAKDLVEDDL